MVLKNNSPGESIAEIRYGLVWPPSKTQHLTYSRLSVVRPTNARGGSDVNVQPIITLCKKFEGIRKKEQLHLYEKTLALFVVVVVVVVVVVAHLFVLVLLLLLLLCTLQAGPHLD